jgi:hypothetical protein
MIFNLIIIVVEQYNKEQNKKEKRTHSNYWGNDAPPVFLHNDAYGWIPRRENGPPPECGA